MRALAFTLTLGVAATALAARPADVFVVVDAAAPSAELPMWSQAMAKLSPGAALPPAEAVPQVLAKLVGAAQLDGIDLGKPLHMVLLNPQKYPQPVVLSLPVKNLQALKASVKDSGLTVSPGQGYALVGAEATVKGAPEFLRRLPGAAAPKRGVHAIAYVEPIWSAFGPQILAVKSMMVAQATQPQGGASATPPLPAESI